MKIEASEIKNKSSDKKGLRSLIRTMAIAILVLPLFGLLFDTFSGFTILRHSNSALAAFAGLFLLSVIYLFGEAGSTWIGTKDKVTDPWYKGCFICLCY